MDTLLHQNLDEAFEEENAAEVHKIITSLNNIPAPPSDTQILARVIIMDNPRLETVEHLLQNNYKPDYPDDVMDSRRVKIAGKYITMHSSPLHLAVYQGQADTARLLLRYDADVNKQTQLGKSALHVACMRGHTECVALLIERGSDITLVDSSNNSALGYAINARQAPAVRLLIQAGAPMESVNDCDMTLLDLALFFYHPEIISYLLRGGYDCNQTFQSFSYLLYDSHHYTNSVLYALIMNNDLANTQLLIQCGYRKYYRDYQCMARTSPAIQALLHQTLPPPIMTYLQHTISNPFSLADISRVTIRNSLTTHRLTAGGCLSHLVNQLPLPHKLKEFICFDL